MAQYWIKGDDGEEYGPATLEELSEWVQENRAGVGTLVRKNESGSWEPWQKYPELMALAAAVSSGAVLPGHPQLALAPLFLRFFAYFFDVFLVLGLLIGLINRLLPAPWRVDSEAMLHRMIQGQPFAREEIWLILMSMGLYVLYFTFFHGRTGQTPGKRLCRIRVVNADGLTIGYWKALVRAIGSLFSQIPYYAGFFLALITPNRRTLHDWIAGTYVIRQR